VAEASARVGAIAPLGPQDWTTLQAAPHEAWLFTSERPDPLLGGHVVYGSWGAVPTPVNTAATGSTELRTREEPPLDTREEMWSIASTTRRRSGACLGLRLPGALNAGFNSARLSVEYDMLQTLPSEPAAAVATTWDTPSWCMRDADQLAAGSGPVQ